MPSHRYEKFEPLKNASMALNYLTTMVDKRLDYLPYWMISPHENPAFARHCRVDDAELVASWYEAIVCVRKMLGTDEGREVEEGFYRHLMSCWGPMGLRYHHPYPWSPTNHSSFHEMGYVLSGLNRVLAERPDDKKAEKLAAGLVRGMRKLAIHRKIKTFWSGDWPEQQVIYEFPNDVYIRDRGWDMCCHTGRGEQAIRNGVILHPLAVRADRFKDEVALDLARGIANQLLGVSRYFNYRMEFYGHVHSTAWFAAGLVRLGRISGEKTYIERGKAIYDNVRKVSSSFGWVPEYMAWKPMAKEQCETCCVKDMIELGLELIDCGYPEYWDDVNSFTRNHLVENQIRVGSFVAVDNTIPDDQRTTWRDMDKRIIGGWSGGSLPNSVSLLRFRSIAGCCVGTAPQAIELVWNRAIEYGRKRLTVNIPVDKTTAAGSVEIGYPNEGFIRVRPARPCDVAIRLYPWMGKALKGTINGKAARFEIDGGLAIFRNVAKDATVELSHPLRTREVIDFVAERRFKSLWRGPDVIDVLPHGEPLRLYQRTLGKRKIYPKPPKEKTSGKGFEAKPTEQKR